MPLGPTDYATEWARRLQLALLLKQLRDGERSITQETIAAAVSKRTKKGPQTTQAVSRWLLGLSVPGTETQIALAEWLGVDPGWLLAGDRSAAPAPQTPAKLMSIDLTAAARRRRSSKTEGKAKDTDTRSHRRR